MPHSRTSRRIQIAAFCVLLLTPLGASNFAFAAAHDRTSHAPAWRADHHMHLASPELCRLVGECLPSNNPPAVFAADAVHALDDAHVSKGVILSCAYLFGLSFLHVKPGDLAAMIRRENEFTAAQVAQYPARLVGFLSVNPLADSAIDEVRHWHGSQQLIGLKLHFTASAVEVRNAGQRRQVAKVVSVAAAAGLPMVIHLGGGNSMLPTLNSLFKKFCRVRVLLGSRSLMPVVACRGEMTITWRCCAHSPSTSSGTIRRRDACCSTCPTCLLRTKHASQLLP